MRETGIYIEPDYRDRGGRETHRQTECAKEELERDKQAETLRDRQRETKRPTERQTETQKKIQK